MHVWCGCMWARWQVILEIAMGAAAEEKNMSLAMIYDEILRKKVENMCGQLGADWDYSPLFLDMDESVMRKARRLVCAELNCVSNAIRNLK